VGGEVAGTVVVEAIGEVSMVLCAVPDVFGNVLVVFLGMLVVE
jgi:hypothetical protein